MRIWNRRTPLRIKILLWWQRLWIRENEFHHTLATDTRIIVHMCSCEKERYGNDLASRRHIAHERDEGRQ